MPNKESELYLYKNLLTRKFLITDAFCPNTMILINTAHVIFPDKSICFYLSY